MTPLAPMFPRFHLGESPLVAVPPVGPVLTLAGFLRHHLALGLMASLLAGAGPLLSHPSHFSVQLPAPSAPGNAAAFHLRPTEARLAVTIVDAATGLPTPVRVRITDENGEPLGLAGVPNYPAPGAVAARLAVPGSVLGLPPEAIGVMYGANDQAQGYAFQRNGAFYVNGSFEMPMPAGQFTVTLSKGYEYIELTDQVQLARGDRATRNYELDRWIDMPARGWYSADDHIHLRRSPRENPLIRDWIAAEDVHVGILLQMGDFWTTYFSQYAFGEPGLFGAGRFLLSSGQEEPRTSELGHTISLGARNFVRFQNDYYSYDRVFDRVHELGGVSGFAHQGMTFHGYRGMTLDVLAGKLDFLELMQFCSIEGPLALENYYHFLDLGFRLTALGGSDFPWCGRGMRFGVEDVGPQIGDARFYTYTGGPLVFDRWLQGVKSGNTFVSTGPMVDLRVNGQLPGTQLDLRAGARLRISAKAFGHPAQIPLQRLQIIGHRRILAEVTAGAPGQTAGELTVDLGLVPEHGLWIAARADAGPTQVAHTTPVYVTVAGDGFHNRGNLAERIRIARGHLQEIRDWMQADAAGTYRQTYRAGAPLPVYPNTAARLERRIANAEKILADLARR